ncbi:unnamed protein product [Mytilus edulis]|uniref:B box-type domain-containing protein n=1 Tax=Mytilus edulis TaxID=6550 RepID=A0A8S3RC65_MYTED|nr:unnamed protein product [Mytilus edulis]
MASNTSVCAICDLRHITSRSMHWCPECEEALCPDCSEHHSLSKGTRAHKTIPISQYQSLPTFVTDIQQFCIYHNEKYQQYCMTHECPICYKCIKEHGKCTDVIPLEDVIGEIKSSELFRDLEQTLKDVLGNISRIRKDREDNVQSIQTQKKKITMEIDKIKTQINQRIEKLKESVIKELEKVYDDYNGRIKSIISALKVQEHEIKHCSTEFEHIKNYASDLQTFIGIRGIQSKLTDNEERYMSMNENKSLHTVEIQLAIDEKIQGILTSVVKFGSIIIKESPSACTHIDGKKSRQAQISVPIRMQSLNTLSVDFIQKLDTNCIWIRGCSRTRTGTFHFTDYGYLQLKIVILNAQGKNNQIFSLLTPYSAFDIVCIDEKTVAVTTGKQGARQGNKSGICIVDLTKKKETQFIELHGSSFGITYDGTSLIACVQGKDIHVISCIDYSIATIPNTMLTESSVVSTHSKKIFYTNLNENRIYCCLYDGTPVWEFNNDILKTPRGITVDNNGNVFVVGHESCNVLIISPDGKQYKQILNKESGLYDPYAIFFDKLRNQLIVANNSSVAFLYNISYL